MQRLVSIRTGVVVLMLVLVGIVAFVVSAATTYNDPGGQFSFTTPDSYVQRFRAGTDVSFRSESAQTSAFEITVIAHAPDPLQDADTIAANTLKGLKGPPYTVGNTGVVSTTLSNQSARRFDYYTALEGISTRTHTLEIIAVTAKAAYVLIFTATETDYDRMLNDTAIVLGSFSFTGNGALGSMTTGSSATTGSSVTDSSVTATGVSDLAQVTAPTAAAIFPVGSTGTTNGNTATLPNVSTPPAITTPVVGTGPIFTISTPTAVLAPSTSEAITATATGSVAPVFTISTPTAVLAAPSGVNAATMTTQATAGGRIGGIATFGPRAPDNNTRDRT